MDISKIWSMSSHIVHYGDVVMGTVASQITNLTIVYSTVYSGADQRKHQSSASLAFVRWIHRWPVNSPHKWPVTRKKFPFDDVIVLWQCSRCLNSLHNECVKFYASQWETALLCNDVSHWLVLFFNYNITALSTCFPPKADNEDIYDLQLQYMIQIN